MAGSTPIPSSPALFARRVSFRHVGVPVCLNRLRRSAELRMAGKAYRVCHNHGSGWRCTSGGAVGKVSAWNIDNAAKGLASDPRRAGDTRVVCVTRCLMEENPCATSVGRRRESDRPFAAYIDAAVGDEKSNVAARDAIRLTWI